MPARHTLGLDNDAALTLHLLRTHSLRCGVDGMVKLRTLGECVIEVGDTRIAPDSKVLFALLLYLGLERGRRFTRSALMEMFWPDSPPAKAAHSLRQTIYQLRKLGAPIEVSKTDVSIRQEDVASDLDTLERAKNNGSRTIRGDFLPSYSAGVSESYSAWLDEHRNIVGAKIRRGLLTELSQLKSKGDWQHIETVAGDLLKLDPLNEEATLLIAEAAAMRGNKVGAVRILERFASEVGGEKHLQLPASILRKRIGEQFKDDDQQNNPFVGRSDTLALLNRQLDRAKHGEGSCLLVWGEPGIGKSRLVSEFHKSARLQGFQTVKVECQLADASRPLSAFVEAVPALMQLRGSLGCSPHSLALLRTLITHAVADSAAPPVPEHDGAAQLTRAIIDLIDAILVETPLLLIVEDVHWLDAVSWETIAHLAKVATTRRLLGIVTSREQYPKSAPSDGCESLMRYALKPLADKEARRLFFEVGGLSSIALSGREEQWFIDAAEGNPYFVRELARHFTDTGQMYAIPASLESLLSARLKQISSNALRLLQVCGLLGRHSTFDRIGRVLETDSMTLMEALEDLEVHELVMGEGTRVSSKHALLTDQAIRLCSPGTTRLLHRRIASILEAELLQTHSATLLWTCAEHLRLAGESSLAMKLAQSCGNHLLGMGLINDAVSVLEQALTMSTHHEDRIEILRCLSLAYRASRDWKRTAAALSEVSELRSRGPSGATRHDEDELRLIVAQWFADSGDYEGARWPEYVTKLMTCIRSQESSTVHRLEAAQACLVVAENAMAPQEMDQAYDPIKHLLNDDGQPFLVRLWIRAIYGTTRGSLEDGICAARELLSYYRGIGNVWELIKMQHNASLPLRFDGRFDEAHRNLGEGIKLSEERNLWRSYIDLLDTSGTLYLQQDRYDEAKRSHTAAMDKLPEAAHSMLAVRSLMHLGTQIALAEGDVLRARSVYRPPPEHLADSTRLVRDDAFATEILISAGINEAVEANLVDCLLRSHEIAKENGRRDFVTTALFVGLRALGREEEGRLIMTAYLDRHRRERYPLPQFLARLMRVASG